VSDCTAPGHARGSMLRLHCLDQLDGCMASLVVPQGEAIAYQLAGEMFGLRVPVISVVIGEGGSGGAPGHRLCQQELDHAELRVLCCVTRGMCSHPVEEPLGQQSGAQDQRFKQPVQRSQQLKEGAQLVSAVIATELTLRCVSKLVCRDCCTMTAMWQDADVLPVAPAHPACACPSVRRLGGSSCYAS